MDIDLPGLGRFTTNHPTSSYGVPVLVIDGEAYGPGDQVPLKDSIFPSMPALNLYIRWQEKWHQSGVSGCQQDPEDKTHWEHSEECNRIGEAYRLWSATALAPCRKAVTGNRRVYSEPMKNLTVLVPVELRAALDNITATALRLSGANFGLGETVRGLLAYALEQFDSPAEVAQYLLKGQEGGGEGAGK